jgi:hypothetical protein
MRIRVGFAFALFIVPLCGMRQAQGEHIASAGAADKDVPIIVDEEPEAFFVEAPWALARRMRGALKVACAGDTSTSIFCDGTPLRFLREVSAYGNKKGFGFACTRDSLYARNKYFTPGDIRGKDSCIWIKCPSGYSCKVDPSAISKVNGNP